jgi:hypothetical protein
MMYPATPVIGVPSVLVVGKDQLSAAFPAVDALDGGSPGSPASAGGLIAIGGLPLEPPDGGGSAVDVPAGDEGGSGYPMTGAEDCDGEPDDCEEDEFSSVADTPTRDDPVTSAAQPATPATIEIYRAHMT